jgi:tetratricopeptide (TPR) repeat protein
LIKARQRFIEDIDYPKTAECENYLALAYQRNGEVNEARLMLEQAFMQPLEKTHPIRLYSHILESHFLIDENKNSEVISRQEKLKSLFEESGNHYLVGSFYLNIALAYKNLGRLEDAINHYKIAKNSFTKAEHDLYLGLVLNNLANLYKCQREFGRANDHVDLALEVFHRNQNIVHEAFCMDTKAQILYAEGRFEEALEWSSDAVETLKPSDCFRFLVDSYTTKAKILMRLRQFDEALDVFNLAVGIARFRISENIARIIAADVSEVIHEMTSPQVRLVEMFEEELSFSNLKAGETNLILPADFNYPEYSTVIMRNNRLKEFGIGRGCLAIIAVCEVEEGDLIAILNVETNMVHAGVYDSESGVIALHSKTYGAEFFDLEDVRFLGKVVGIGKDRVEINGQTSVVVEPLTIDE